MHSHGPHGPLLRAKLTSLDRLALIDLVKDLYAADRGNQVFLHARFGLSESGSQAIQRLTLDRWLWPDVLRNQDTSVTEGETGHLRLSERLLVNPQDSLS